MDHKYNKYVHFKTYIRPPRRRPPDRCTPVSKRGRRGSKRSKRGRRGSKRSRRGRRVSKWALLRASSFVVLITITIKLQCTLQLQDTSAIPAPAPPGIWTLCSHFASAPPRLRSRTAQSRLSQPSRRSAPENSQTRPTWMCCNATSGHHSAAP